MAKADPRTDEVFIPEGKVEQVRKEWSVKEDGVLAYQLQNEEINKHYDGNRSKNQVVRHDHVQAREEQRDIMLRYEQQLHEQELEDERAAMLIQESVIQEQENQLRHQMMVTEEDERLAKKLQTKEREKLMKRRLLREKEQVEKIRAQKILCAEMQELGASAAAPQELSDRLAEDLDGIDLSEFCMKPPPGLSQEELRVFLAEQDAEIASFLQQYEAKRKNTGNGGGSSSSSGSKDKLMAIEAQDHEIAKILQEEEKAKARRVRERMRQKQLHKQRQQQQQQLPQDEGELTAITGNYGNGNYAQYQSHLDGGGAGGGGGSSSGGSAVDIARRALPPIPNYHNIAMDLDPTYNRRADEMRNADPNGNQALEHEEEVEEEQNHPQPPVEEQLSGVHFAVFARVSPAPSPTANSSPPVTFDRRSESISHQSIHRMVLADGAQDTDTIGSASDPGYLGVVQGQRRSNGKVKGKKGTKDGCKTQ